jgi:hypothetical protein
MTPEEEAYRDAWVAEMWQTVYQYVPPTGAKERPRVVHKAGDKRPKKVA